MVKRKLKAIVSKRQMYRRNAGEIREVTNDLNNCVGNELPEYSENVSHQEHSDAENLSDIVPVSDSTTSFEIDSVTNFSEYSECKTNNSNQVQKLNVSPNTSNLKSQLQQWATTQKVSHRAITDLLHILSPHHPELPLDSRTLLCTPGKYDIETLQYGDYIHIGLEHCLIMFLKRNPKYPLSTFLISLNIDGLPLFNSTNMQLWPILGLVKNWNAHQPFVIGIFCGTSKPVPLVAFFKKFIDEYSYLKNGFFVNTSKYSVEIHSFVCDAPAKAFIKSIKSPGGYACCDKCTEFGQYVHGRVILKGFSAPKRTNASFRNKTDEDHHVGDDSPLLQLDIDMIELFPIDYMHNVCLGVTRKLLMSWTSGDLSVRLPSRLVNLISVRLTSLKEYVPSEINRKPRSLSELARFKATEFRTFLLYTGMVVLLDVVSKKIYYNFLLFHTAIATLMSFTKSTKEVNCEIAEKLLQTFILDCCDIYGPQFLIYNVHVLSHLTDSVLRYGSLDNFSAFPFENYLGQLKRLVKSPNKPLQQIYRRLVELDEALLQDSHNVNEIKLHLPHCNGPVLGHFQKQFKKVSLSRYVLSIHSYSLCDCYCFTNDTVIQIENIVSNENDTKNIKIIGRYFTNICSFYNYPFESQLLNIYLVSSLSENMKSWSLSDITGKCFLMPRESNWVSVPLFHTYSSV